jgi:hypothetical protein
MSRKTRERIHLIYGSVLAALIVAVGVCLALSCLSIYKSGESPFTRESIAAHFDRFEPLVYVMLAGILGGVLLAWLFPRRDLVVSKEEDDPLDVIVERYRRGHYRSVRDPAAVLKRQLARVDEETLSPARRAAMGRERKLRRLIGALAAGSTVLFMLPALLWCVNPAHFSIEKLNADIKTAALLLIPCTVMALGICVAAVQLRYASVSRETEILKGAVLEAFNQKYKDTVTVGSAAAPTESEQKKRAAQEDHDRKKRITDTPRFLWGVRGVILAVGILFVLLGIFNGGMADVLGKAIRICTECIGLG